MNNRAVAFAQFLWDLRRLAREKITLEGAQRTIRRRLADREPSFLAVVREAIYENPHSPYLPLLERAQCELGDLETMVSRDGIEKSLAALHAAGVYVSLEEFKGRAPIVRGDLVRHVHPSEFDNPTQRPSVSSTSGGSSGRPIRVAFQLDNVRNYLPINLVQFAALDVVGAPAVSWWEGLPATTGLQAALRCTAVGNPMRHWFTVLSPRPLRNAVLEHAAMAAIVATMRSAGVRIPRPRSLSLEDALVVARWASEALDESGRCLVMTNVSRAVRIALAARENGIDLTGATLYGAADPATEAKSGRSTPRAPATSPITS